MKSLTAGFGFLISTSVISQTLMKPKYGPRDHPIATPFSQDHKFLTQSEQPDFWALIPYDIGQMNECSCSVAVTATVLNALRIAVPKSSDDRMATKDSKSTKYRGLIEVVCEAKSQR